MSGTSPIVSKEEAVNRVSAMDKDKRHQGAIVDLMLGKGRIEKIIHEIPGGSFLTEQLDSDNLKGAVFTWLRRIRDFERYEISFVGDYDTEDQLREWDIRPKKTKIVDFGWRAGAPFYWRKKGITELANLVAQALNENEDLVSIIVEREGIFIITDTSHSISPENTNWHPVLIVHKQR